jgi:hypothetical protein
MYILMLKAHVSNMPAIANAEGHSTVHVRGSAVWLVAAAAAAGAVGAAGTYHYH